MSLRWFRILRSILSKEVTLINLRLHLSFRKGSIDPDVTVLVDQDVLSSGPQNLDSVIIQYDRKLDPGNHRLEIRYHNMTKITELDPCMAVIVEKVSFQSVEHDFKVYSRYRPDYPSAWLQEQISQGRPPAEQIHSNYLGWNGVWCLDFQTPIYQWIHRRMDLGWLI